MPSHHIAGLACFLALLLSAPAARAQITEVIAGLVVDENTGRPVPGASVELLAGDGKRLGGSGLEALTDANGRFKLAGVPVGLYQVRVWHLAYGLYHHAVRVEGSGTASIEISISETAIKLAPLAIEAERDAVADSLPRSSAYVATRDEIAEAARSGLSLLDFLPRRFSGIYLQRSGQVGIAHCLQFRQARSDGICRFPAVHLDGTTVSKSSSLQLLASFSLFQLERIEIIPLSSSAGGGYGLDGISGTIVLETPVGTRRSAAGSLARPTRRVQTNYDWSEETEPYPWGRVYAAAFVGNAAGLAAGLTALGHCADLGQYRPRYEVQRGHTQMRCSAGLLIATGLVATALPALGGSVAARIAGATGRSTGLVKYSALASQAVFIPAMALVVTNGNPDGKITAPELFALGLATLGAPLLNTLVDRFFRVFR